MKNIIFLTMLLFALAQGSDEVPAPAQDHPIALTGGTVHTVSGAVIENGMVLFDNGKIVAIGVNLDLPEGTERIDISGKHVYPALIEANSTIGLVEISAVRATRDYAESGAVTPEARAEAAFNPDSEILPVTRANGIALALSVPASGLISGTSALMMLDGWTWEQMTLKAPVGLHIRWPSIREPDPKQQKSGEIPQYVEEIDKIRRAFADARAYHKAQAAQNDKAIPAHAHLVRWEAMGPVLRGEVPVFVHADDIRQIQTAVSWAGEEKLKMVLVGGYDAWRVSELLKEEQIPVIIAGIHQLPNRRWEDYDAPFTLPKKLHDAGIKFCIAGSGGAFAAAHARNLPYEAATAAAYGLPREVALQALTLFPAQILGVEDRVGSLETGKDATLIVTDGDPLEIVTRVEMEFIQGRRIDLSSRHTRLYEKYRRKYQQMELLGE